MNTVDMVLDYSMQASIALIFLCVSYIVAIVGVGRVAFVMQWERIENAMVYLLENGKWSVPYAFLFFGLTVLVRLIVSLVYFLW